MIHPVAPGLGSLLEQCVFRPGISYHVHTSKRRWTGSRLGSGIQKGAPICEIPNTTPRNGPKMPVITMKLPHACILGYGHTCLHMNQDLDTHYVIALLYWEFIFACGGELYSCFTTKESIWLLMTEFLWTPSKSPEKYVHSVYLFWLNLSNNISFRLLFINTATHAAIQISR